MEKEDSIIMPYSPQWSRMLTKVSKTKETDPHAYARAHARMHAGTHAGNPTKDIPKLAVCLRWE